MTRNKKAVAGILTGDNFTHAHHRGKENLVPQTQLGRLQSNIIPARKATNMRLEQLYTDFSTLTEPLQRAFIDNYRAKRSADIKRYIEAKNNKASTVRKPKAKKKKTKITLTPDELALLNKMGLKGLAKGKL